MIRRVRNKFILSAILSIFIVLSVILASLSAINYVTTVRQADEMLSFLAENGGKFPEGGPLGNDPAMAGFPQQPSGEAFAEGGMGPAAEGRDGDGPPPLPEILPEGETAPYISGQPLSGRSPGVPAFDEERFRQKNGRGFLRSLEINEETPYTTRFFTVLFDEHGEIQSADIGNIAAIEEADAKEYAVKVFSSGKEKGFLSSYRYKRTDTDDGFMILFLDCRQDLSSFRSVILISILVGLGGMAAFLLLTILLSRIIMRPVADSYTRQKQFITDAGHELRTPLSVIDANTEVMEMLHGEDEWTQSTRRQVKRLSSLTTELIALSKMEEDPKTMQRTEFSLSDAVDECVQDFTAVAASSGKEINASIEPGILYSGEEKSIRQLLAILLDNAVKYCLPDHAITLSLTRKGRGVQFIISNPADNVTKGKQNRLFERFYRTDASRSSKTGGYGIGLSIAHAVVERHKGKIAAESTDGKSLTITVIL